MATLVITVLHAGDRPTFTTSFHRIKDKYVNFYNKH